MFGLDIHIRDLGLDLPNSDWTSQIPARAIKCMLKIS